MNKLNFYTRNQLRNNLRILMYRFMKFFMFYNLYTKDRRPPGVRLSALIYVNIPFNPS